jgi:type I restriction enzyme, S subunit
MSPEAFLADFGTLAEAPGSVKKLREMILELAMRGRLVAQDPRDVPASQLLEDISRERVQLSAKPRLTRSPQIDAPKDPYPLPVTWTWVTADTVFHVITDGDHQPPPKSETGIPFLVIGNVCTGRLSFHGTRFVPEEYYSSLAEIRIPRKGDLLYTVVGSYGVPVIVDTSRPFCVQRHIAILKPSEFLDVRYAFYSLQSPLAFQQATACATGTAQKTVPPGGLRRIALPLPSINEQRRIVAKIDQLMAMCDDLEAKQTRKQEAGVLLTRAALDALTSAEGPEEFAAAWQRVTDDFEILFDKPERIGELRKAILGLALHGRLVKQVPADEPTDTLLVRISRSRMADTAQGPRSIGESSCEEEERHALPGSWQWVTVGNIADCVLGKMLDKSKHTKGELRPYLRNINARWGAFDLSDLLSMYFEDDELERYGVRDGDVLICEGGEPGRSAVWRNASKTMLFQKALHRVRLHGGIAPEWLVMNLRYDSWAGRLEGYFTGATIKHFTGQALTRYSIRLAPIAEQKRIIAKVNQLMALCDELETKLRDTEKGAQRLAEAMTAAMVA